MARDSREYDVGGELRDAYGRSEYVVVPKHTVPAATDSGRGYSPTDSDGRVQIVMLDQNGNDWGSFNNSMTINVLDKKYGAKGDGVTDDTSAVQAAIAAASAKAPTNGVVDVWLPPGYGFLLGQLQVKSGTRLLCYGAQMIPTLNWNVNQGWLYWGSVGILKNFSVCGGLWAGTGTEPVGMNVFYVQSGSGRGVQDCTFKDMLINNWAAGGLYMRNPTRCKALDNTMLSLGANTTFNTINFVYDGGAAAGGEIIARGNIIDNNAAAAIAAVLSAGTVLNAQVRAIFTDNIVSGVPGSSIASGNSGSISFEQDISGDSWSNCIIANNDVVGYPTLNHGAIIAAGGGGGLSTKVKVTDNIVATPGAAGSGVIVSGSADSVDIHDNDLSGCLIPINDTSTSSSINKRNNRYSATGALTGRATLVAGTVTVSNAEIRTGDNVLLNVVTPGGTRGIVQLGAIVNGTSFVINSIQPGTASTVQAADTSTVAYEIIH